MEEEEEEKGTEEEGSAWTGRAERGEAEANGGRWATGERASPVKPTAINVHKKLGVGSGGKSRIKKGGEGGNRGKKERQGTEEPPPLLV